MKNLLRYEFYKARHSLLLYIVFVVCCVIAIFFTDESYLMDPIVVNTPQNLFGIFINEVADAGIAILLLVACYIIFEFSDNLKHRCINYELMSGNSRGKVFFSHYIYNFILSGSMIMGSLFMGCCKYGVANLIKMIWENRMNTLKIALYVYVISFSLVSICMVAAIIFKDTAKSTIITFIFLFLACYIMASIAAAISGTSLASAYEKPPLMLLLYLPYLWRWILNPELTMVQLIGGGVITVVWSGIAFCIGNCCFCKTELQ